MLKPRRENSAAMRARTPGLFSTRTERVCLLIAIYFPSLSASSGCSVASSSSRSHCGAVSLATWMASLLTPAGHHRPDHGVAVDDEVDDDRDVVDLHGLLDGRVDVLRTLAPQADAAVGVGELDEVGDAAADRGVQVGVGVALVVEQRLPLAHHAEAAVVDDRDLDRDVVDDAGRELLVGHLEAAVTVDRPDRALRLGDLRAHGGRHGIPHRPEATGVEPGVRALVLDELGRPHLVLADAGDVDRLGPADRADALDDVLRRTRSRRPRAWCSRAGRSPSSRRSARARRRSRRPCRPRWSAATALMQLADDLEHVADDRHVGGAVLGDLGGVDVGVDDLGLGGERRQLAGHPVVEPGAEGDEQVGLLQCGHRRDRAVHARHAQVQRVAVGHGAARHQRGHDRDLGQLDELAQRVGGVPRGSTPPPT